jgi:hypothetical protein
MPSTDRKLELKAKTLVAQTASQAAVYAKGLILIIYWKKTGLLHTKISNHNIIYSS